MVSTIFKDAMRAFASYKKKPLNSVIETIEAMNFHPTDQLVTLELFNSEGSHCDDADLVQRIIAAYHAANKLPLDNGSFWSDHFGGKKAEVHAALSRGNVREVSDLLRNPATNDLFYGFDSLCLWQSMQSTSPETDRASAKNLYDAIKRLAESMGAARLYYPEALGLGSTAYVASIEELISSVVQRTGHDIQFPNPYPAERGLMCSRGIVSWRALQAIYQAKLICEEVKDMPLKRVVEVGAGLGRTAYYAISFGIKDYTIVDLPLTNVAQAYFLGRTLGDNAISLFGEEQQRRIRICPSEEFMTSNNRFDAAFNADSLVEMSRATANDYLNQFKARSMKFVSINHEYNQFTVNEMCLGLSGCELRRYPYWMRKGYAQEVIIFQN